MSKYIGIIGSRMLPEKYRFHVHKVVSQLLEKGHCVNSGGAMGADSYAIAALLRNGKAHRGVIYSAWTDSSGFPSSVKKEISEFAQNGGKIIQGNARPYSARQEVVDGLLGRNIKLVENSDALVAYLYGESRGTTYTIKEAARKDIPIIIFLCGENARLPHDIKATCAQITEDWILSSYF